MCVHLGELCFCVWESPGVVSVFLYAPVCVHVMSYVYVSASVSVCVQVYVLMSTCLCV